MIHEQTFLWKPKAKARPRVTKFGTYTDKATLDAEKNLAEQYDGPKYEGPIGVVLGLYNERIEMMLYEVEPYLSRKLRGDIDNYSKLALDALNGVAYLDDGQIVSLQARKY